MFRERVLSGEVELQYVPTDRQTADSFTKPLGLDKLRQFSGALGLRHLDMPNLRGSDLKDLKDLRSVEYECIMAVFKLSLCTVIA